MAAPYSTAPPGTADGRAALREHPQLSCITKQDADLDNLFGFITLDPEDPERAASEPCPPGREQGLRKRCGFRRLPAAFRESRRNAGRRAFWPHQRACCPSPPPQTSGGGIAAGVRSAARCATGDTHLTRYEVVTRNDVAGASHCPSTSAPSATTATTRTTNIRAAMSAAAVSITSARDRPSRGASTAPAEATGHAAHPEGLPHLSPSFDLH
jgi:hypothetical protein